MANFEQFNRDLSWLSFNHRVLEEAKDDSVPLYDRIKFLAIYSNNLEEFYRVRVSYYRNLIRGIDERNPLRQKVKPEEIIAEITRILMEYRTEFSNVYRTGIVPALHKNLIFPIRPKDKLSPEQQAFVGKIFDTVILPYLQPVLLKRKRIKPFLKTGQLYIAIKFYKKGIPQFVQMPSYGIIKVPTDHDIPRFFELPNTKSGYFVIFLEDIIMRKIGSIFPGYHVVSWHSIKVTRDADLDYDDYTGDNLIEAIEDIDSNREVGLPNRFQYDYHMPNHMVEFLRDTFDLSAEDMVLGGSIHNFRDFFSFPNPLAPQLEYESTVPLRLQAVDKADSFLNEISKKDFLVHYPYQSYNYVIRFLNEAANDPLVEAIKITQYRVASNSAVVNELVRAAENGKKVTVFVELKARFDEEANLQYAKDMTRAGIRIIYSIPGLKVHAKIALIVRKNPTLGPQNLAYVSTGNFNEKTARIYVDHGYFSAEPILVNDIGKLFNYLENQSKRPEFKHILVPGFNMVETFLALIKRESEIVKKGGTGYIFLKMNGLEEPTMIDALYKASSNGVKIDILVRGACCLIPNKSYSKNITLRRIVDRYLEHDRLYLFGNKGENDLYMGSADWMKRNLRRRIECVVPIKNKKLKQEMLDLIAIQLSDTDKARLITSPMENQKIETKGKKLRSQTAIYQYLADAEAKRQLKQ